MFIAPGTVDGQEACVLIDTGSLRTIVLGTGADEEVSVSLAVGGVKLGKRYVQQRDIPVLTAIKGIYESASRKGTAKVCLLGRDILKEFAVGFDYTQDTVSFWAGGSLSADSATAWMRALPAWPGAQPSIGSVDLEMYRDSFCLPIQSPSGLLSLGMLDTGATRGELTRDKLERLTAGPGTEDTDYSNAGASKRMSTLVPEVLIGGVRTIWWPVGIVAAPSPGTRGDGLIALSDFRSRRLLLDMPAKKLYLERFVGDANLSFALSQFLPYPIRIAGDKAFMGPLYSAWAWQGAKSVEGDEVISIAGFPTKDVISALRGSGADAQQTMSKLFVLTRHDFVIELIHRGQKTDLQIRY
ncbi:MAG TPA: hypothetical protein VMI31_14440 [Fimbriimonadaceae bacterium]|nr:hypothetical protein [Fimbriimonadaceae bacterium]